MPSGRGVPQFEDQGLKSLRTAQGTTGPPHSLASPSRFRPRGRPRAPASLRPVRAPPSRPSSSGPGGLIPLAGGSSPNCTLGKSARDLPPSPLHLRPGGLPRPSAPPRPARPSAPQVSVSRVRWGPGRARREGAAGRAQFAPGALEAETLLEPHLTGPVPWMRYVAFPTPWFSPL